MKPLPAATLALAAATAAVLLGDRWWPMSVLALAPLLPVWAALAALGALHCLPLAGGPGADPAHWLARAAMLPMLAGLPAMLALCSPSGWPPAAMVALHAGAMLLPMAWPGRVPPAAGPVAMALSALPLLAWPGALGWMLGSALQAVACGLAMRARPAGGSRLTAALASTAATALLALVLARGGAQALQQLQLALALAALLPAWAAAGRRPEATA